MEESGNVREDKFLPDKNNKRRLKTPAQVEALEKLYNAHKYPTESMKSQLAEELGLSEKQISGWLCHRRLKDKNMLKDESCANGRHDPSSGVIQDRGSGLKQDSCSSTKQGEYRRFDPREVESQRFYGQNYRTADFMNGNKGQYVHNRNCTSMDNTSSGSSSASHERLIPESEDPYDMEPSRYSSQNCNYMPVNVKGVKNKGYMLASGYFHSLDEVEIAAISSVKRQLGRHYREDGPPLGVRFQSLPSGAFDMAIRDSISEPYYVGDPIVRNSLTVPRVRKEHTFDNGYTRHNHTMHPQGSYPERAVLKRTMRDSSCQNKWSNKRSMQKSSFTNRSNYGPDKNSTMDNIDEDSSGEASEFNRSRNYEMRPKNSVAGMISDSITTYHHFHRYAGKAITGESSHPRLHNHDDSISHVFQRGKYLEGRPSNLKLRPHEFLDNEDSGYFRRMTKEEKVHRERRMSKEFTNPVRVKMLQKNKMRAREERMQDDELLPRDCASMAPSPQALLLRENQIRGYAGEMPTSFSEDETAATSSSMD